MMMKNAVLSSYPTNGPLVMVGFAKLVLIEFESWWRESVRTSEKKFFFLIFKLFFVVGFIENF